MPTRNTPPPSPSRATSTHSATPIPPGQASCSPRCFPASVTPEIWAPLHLEYGVNTTFGEDSFLNLNCVILDIAPINIGRGALFGPGCQLITVEHSVENVQQRAEGWERGRPITIGANCWFGAGAIVLPGVTIGDNCVIAAGAVVNKDIPANTLVAGVPARTIRSLA